MRGRSSPDEVAIEKNTTGASWPWNLSTVPTRTPSGSALAQTAHLGVVGRDDEDVVAADGRVLAVRVGERRAGEQADRLGAIASASSAERLRVALVLDRQPAQPGAGQCPRESIALALAIGAETSRPS